LRDRVTLGFGLLALALSGLLAVVVGLLVSQYLQDQRRSSAIEQTALSAASLERTLATSTSDIPTVLDDAPANDRASSLLDYGGSWYATSLSAGPSALPAELVSLVRSGTSATQRITINGRPYLAVGTPLGKGGSSYFELFGLDELDNTYHVLSITLVAAAIVTAGLGLAVGRFASGRVLRPLAELTETASRVARGDLGARLQGEDDPDMGELARSFNNTAAALDRRVVNDARFAGDVSHELRTPVMTMLNSVEVLQNHRSELSPALQEPLDLLAADLQRFRRLVVDLLEISRDEGQQDGELREPVVIGELVRAAAASVTTRDLTTVDPSAQGLRLLADKRRLERVVVDLVENAEKHGGGCRQVSVDRDDGQVRILVDDAGPGVPPERRERIFDRFAREGGDRSSSDGVGLGLAIVERHVRWHGGSVSVADRPGGGARFVVTMPVRRT
jgi:signal transduction histidine kinase